MCAETRARLRRSPIRPLPKCSAQALRWLTALIMASKRVDLRTVSTREFKQGWYAICFLYPGLHPDGALAHGKQQVRRPQNCPEVAHVEPRLLAPYYARSGWPVVLAPIAREAWRRYEDGGLTDEEFYCAMP